MVDKGIVIPIKDRNRTVYGLHPIFYNDKFWEEYIDKLRNTMMVFIKCMDTDEYIEFKTGGIDPSYILKLLVEILVN